MRKAIRINRSKQSHAFYFSCKSPCSRKGLTTAFIQNKTKTNPKTSRNIAREIAKKVLRTKFPEVM